jgi:chromodomain-helicase-DNA-binding protein 4
MWFDISSLEALSSLKVANFLTKKFEMISEGQILGDEAEVDDSYYYGIYKPYLQPERIISVSYYHKEPNQYLVKWNELDYENWTWVNRSYLADDYPELILQFEHLQRLENKLASNPSLLDQIKRTCEHGRANHYESFKEQPSFINSGKLYDYQLKGLNWLAYSWHQSNNVILADEMGLGKTIQTSWFINYLISVHKISRPFLIWVPLSTLNNWKRELKIWLPDSYVVVLFGNKRSRDIWREKDFFMKAPKLKKIPKFNILLVTYEVILSEQAFLSKIKWRALIIDEGQRLKNQRSKFYEKASTIPWEFRILLSGTPLQNNFDELLNLCKFISPEKFDEKFNKELREIFNKSLLARSAKESNYKSKSDHLTYDEKDIEKETDLVNTLYQHLGCHLLRRRKKDVLKNFPKKKEVLIHTYLTKRQRQIYKLIFLKNYEALNLLEKSWNKNTKVSLRNVNNVLMYLRLCWDHPFLLSPKYNPNIKAGENLNEEIDQDEMTNDLIQSSGKMKVLNQMLPKLLKDGHKILIFSQFKLMLNIIEDFLSQNEIKFLRLDGDTKSFLRQRLIDSFNKIESQYQIFLLSTKAGGLGINLHTADTIFIIDSDFNPHNDLQALSRAHRIGQKNNILIFRLISRSTWEEKLIETAQHKLLLGGLYVQRDKRIKNIDTANSKAAAIETKEMNEVLKYGANVIFKNNEEDSYNDRDFTSEEINDLLDREKQFADLDKEENEADDYFSAFRVAQMKDKVEGAKSNNPSSESQPNQSWKELIGKDVVVNQVRELEKLGKGKRKRAKVIYSENKRKKYSSEDVSSEEEASIEAEGEDEEIRVEHESSDLSEYDEADVEKIIETCLSSISNMDTFLLKTKNKMIWEKIFHKGYTIEELKNVQKKFKNHRDLETCKLKLRMLKTYILHRINLNRKNESYSRWLKTRRSIYNNLKEGNEIPFRPNLLYFLKKSEYPSNWLDNLKTKMLIEERKEEIEFKKLEFPLVEIKSLTKNKNVINAIIIQNHYSKYDQDSIIVSNFNQGERKSFMKFLLMYGLRPKHPNFLYEKLNHKHSKHFNGLIFKKQFDYYEYTAFIWELLSVLNKIESAKTIPHFLFNNRSAENVVNRIEDIALLSAIFEKYRKQPNNFIIEHPTYLEAWRAANLRWNPYDDFLLIVNILDYGYGEWAKIIYSKRWIWSFEWEEFITLIPESKLYTEKWDLLENWIGSAVEILFSKIAWIDIYQLRMQYAKNNFWDDLKAFIPGKQEKEDQVKLFVTNRIEMIIKCLKESDQREKLLATM